jgi:biopolymer transport protein ExbB
MMDLVQRSGPVIYALALCSLVAMAVTIERFIALRRSRVLPQQIVDVVEAIQPGKDLSLALEICRRNPGVLSNVLRAGLENAEQQWEVMRDAVIDAGRQGTPAIERHLFWLQTVAQASPLLGLLGTVFGMIQMFSAVSLYGLGDPQVLSKGIGVAMLTTAEGLCIGIPALVAYNYLRSRSESLIAEIEAYASRMVARLRPPQPERVP